VANRTFGPTQRFPQEFGSSLTSIVVLLPLHTCLTVVL
jgi:hypothetical protein